MADLSLQLEAVDTAQEIVINNYLQIMAVTFLFYDHLITSGNEIDSLWRRPKTQSAYWFFFNRYFTFFGSISVAVLGLGYTLNPQSCKHYSLFHQLFIIANQVLVCVLLTLRIYALYSCSIRVLVYMVGSGAVLMGIACWLLFGQKSAQADRDVGCHLGLSRVTAIRLAGAWEALFVYDTNLFSLTMFKTWKTRHEISFAQRNLTIVYLVLRDGAIYFAVMALANLANILTFYLCGPFMRGGLSVFASAISVTMMSRLMLNLHETADSGIYSTRTDLTNISTEIHTSEIELDTILDSDRYTNTVESPAPAPAP